MVKTLRALRVLRGYNAFPVGFNLQMIQRLSMRILALLLLSSLALLEPESLFGADIKFYSQIEPRSGTLDEDFTFTITLEGGAEANYPLLSGGDDFDLKLIGPQSSMQIINGDVTQQISYVYRLTAKHEGTLKTPSAEVTVNGEKFSAPAIAVTVTAGASGDSNAAPEDKDLFLRQSVSKSLVYVGEQIQNRIEFYNSADLLGARFEEMNFDDFTHEQIGKEERTTEYIRGTPFNHHDIRYALYPLRSGKIELPRRSIIAKVREVRKRSRRQAGQYNPFDPFGTMDDDFFGGFFGSAEIKERTIRSNPLELEVKPLPPAPANFPDLGLKQIPVGTTSVQVTDDAAPLEVGQSRTITVEIISAGNLASLQTLPLEMPKSVRVYSESPTISSREVDGKIISTKAFKVSLVPTTAGTLRLPPVRLGYFDPQSGQFQIAESKPITIEVSGDAAQAPQAASQNAIQPETHPAEQQVEPSELPQYREEGALERLSRQVSLSLSLFLLAVLVVFGGILYFLLRYRTAAQPLRKFRRELEGAASTPELSRVFRDYLQSRLRTRDDGVGQSSLRTALKEKVHNKDLRFAIERVLDQFDSLQYGEGSGSTPELHAIREDVRHIVDELQQS